MSGDHPPPYAPPPAAQGFAVAAPYQAAPSSYYQGPQQYGTPLGYHTAFYDPPQGWDAPKAYGGPPKHTVYVVDQNEGAGRGGVGGGGCGALRSLLSACSTLLCCCCLCDLLTRHL
ncbi:cysteine-rich and transmembrane domain-containing protein 1 [Hippocampus comes]|uniref:cysteine-rich and transmembrane domain-containing protein 1 n=1 Tax=Hippocampus comes TaxID=109280 RepID=UPI00094E89EA|nr:PREDICTED: cysteine-rich and transmembrane domain-containing protein 1 [Hippocampus comes]XP_019728107.1 PREDICTED: cysteine-rich and transmembrane domain-containing protein 1 [Hippocampus comes]